MADDFYKADTPEWLNYLTTGWLKGLPSAQKQYLEGWQPKAVSQEGISFNYPQAYLSNVQPKTQLGDEGKYHWPSKTPMGTWLKAPWHPTHWREDFGVLQNTFDRIKQMTASQ